MKKKNLLKTIRPYTNVRKEERKQHGFRSYSFIHSSNKYVNSQHKPGSLRGDGNFIINEADKIANFSEFTV